MHEDEGLVVRVVARIRALLPRDWFGRAGRRMQDTTQAISDFAQAHRVRPREVIEEGVILGRKKLHGIANREFAEAAKNFAEAEQKKMDAELQRRVFESKVRKEEAEARAAELKVVDAEFELLKKLKEAGVVLIRDEKGNLTVLSSPNRCDLTQLYDEQGEKSVEGPEQQVS